MLWLNNKKKYFLVLFTIVYLVTTFLAPLSLYAQENVKELFPCDPGESTNLFEGDCNFNHLLQLVEGISRRLFRYGMIFSSIIFAYAGFLLLTSQDNPGNRSKAKNIMKNVVIGIALMMCAWVIVNLVTTALLKDEFLNAVPFKK